MVAAPSKNDSPPSFRFVLAVAIGLRLAVPLLGWAVARPAPLWHEPDTAGYLTAAEQLVRTARFGTAEQPEIVRTPGYPLLLAVGVAVGQVDAVTISLQIVLGGLTVWLVYAAALTMFERREIALVSAWFCACEPLSVLYTSKLLTETLFTTLIAAAMWLLARDARRPTWFTLLAAALLTAAAAFVRPIAYFLPAWLASIHFFAGWRSASRWRSLARSAAFFIVAMLPLAAWQVRNYVAAGYASFSAISDINLYYYEAVPLLAAERGLDPRELPSLQAELGFHDDAAYLRRHPEQRSWSPARRFVWLRSEAGRVLRAHPVAAFRVHSGGILHTLTDSGRNAYTHFFGLEHDSRQARQPPPSIIARFLTAVRQKPLVLIVHGLLAVVLVVYLGLASIGLTTSAVRKSPATWPALAIGLYLLLMSGGPAGYHRFRLPLVPVICLLAANGWLAARGIKSRGQRRGGPSAII